MPYFGVQPFCDYTTQTQKTAPPQHVSHVSAQRSFHLSHPQLYQLNSDEFRLYDSISPGLKLLQCNLSALSL